jgi:small subunit ribosomal protein S4
MARYIDPVCKLCRREGGKLFLKGARCYKEKCAIDKKNYAPAQHGKVKRKLSDYGVQLREKQKVKRIYGIMETQFRGYFRKAVKMEGITGVNLLVSLERRLDNVVYRSGIAMSRPQARQFITHGHVMINGEKVDIPSYLIKEGDIISIKESSKIKDIVKLSLETAEGRGVPQWISLDKTEIQAKVLKMPVREDIYADIKEHLIVELYSK